MTPRLLVFDDDPAIGRLAVRVANVAGIQADWVEDAATFERHVLDHPSAIILLDLQLGDTDGIEQLRWLASQKFAGHLILMSGFNARVLGAAARVGQGLGLKIEAALEKPIKVGELEALLARLNPLVATPSNQKLREAIGGDELSLEFQPVVTRRPHTLKKLEALIRWDHPTLGRIPPSVFLPEAEADTAVIDALTDWVIKAAVDAYQVLVELGLSVPIAINVSSRNLHDLALPERLEERLRAASMPADHLCLEITETTAFSDVTRTMDILTRVRLKGMHLAIDDFGTGFSSLKVLRQMPFSELKIDQSFVSDMVTSRDSAVIVKSIIDLAANMGLESVAEGVEDEATATLLESLHVGAIQGYFIARPMPIEAMPAWLAHWLGEDPDRPMEAAADANDNGSGTPAPRLDRVRDVVDALKASHPLSPRQREVMRFLSEGASVKEIARQLELGVGTVKVHLAMAYTALGARNRIEAVRRFTA